MVLVFDNNRVLLHYVLALFGQIGSLIVHKSSVIFIILSFS
ncbi:MAG TPA: hypothetical protein VFP59_13935 [Candidatus Angelobacter sp.]|nr:hypothetical protein [Candidatus Angelobacter sp.]